MAASALAAAPAGMHTRDSRWKAARSVGPWTSSTSMTPKMRPYIRPVNDAVTASSFACHGVRMIARAALLSNRATVEPPDEVERREVDGEGDRGPSWPYSGTFVQRDSPCDQSRSSTKQSAPDTARTAAKKSSTPRRAGGRRLERHLVRHHRARREEEHAERHRKQRAQRHLDQRVIDGERAADVLCTREGSGHEPQRQAGPEAERNLAADVAGGHCGRVSDLRCLDLKRTRAWREKFAGPRQTILRFAARFDGSRRSSSSKHVRTPSCDAPAFDWWTLALRKFP